MRVRHLHQHNTEGNNNTFSVDVKVFSEGNKVNSNGFSMTSCRILLINLILLQEYVIHSNQLTIRARG